MPATRVIIWERRNRLAVDAKRHLESWPAKVQVVHDEREFRAALQATLFPVVLLNRASVGAKLPDVIAAAGAAEARIVVVGPGTADELRRDRDLGGHLLLDDLPERLVWRGTLRRLVSAAQERVKHAKVNAER